MIKMIKKGNTRVSITIPSNKLNEFDQKCLENNSTKTKVVLKFIELLITGELVEYEKRLFS